MVRFRATHVRMDSEVQAALLAISGDTALYRIFYCERDGAEVNRLTVCSTPRFLREFRRVA